MKYKHFFLLLCWLFFALTSVAQIPDKGYEITFKSPTVSDKYLYLTGIYGNKAYIFDSAKWVNQHYVFKNAKKILPAGFYTIESRQGAIRSIHAVFIVDKTRKFLIEDNRGFLSFKNSEENEIFRNFKSDMLMGNCLRLYYETAPESLLGKYVNAQYIPVIIPEFSWGGTDGRDVAAKKRYQFIIDHFFDNVDFKDTRLMYTPLNVDLKEFFLKQLYPQNAELMTICIDNLFERILDENPTQLQLEVQDFYLKKLIHLYMTADAQFDFVFVYLVDNYVLKTSTDIISDSERSVFKRIADRKRKTFVGETIPVFESYNDDHLLISTADITADYTILWFWDPDCDHCLVYTPILCDFYHEYHIIFNFEVLACSVTEDYDRWKRYIKEHHLDWINTSYAIAEPNYYAEDYFNFADTPAIFIIDKQHKIVARQFPLDDLKEVFETLLQEK